MTPTPCSEVQHSALETALQAIRDCFAEVQSTAPDAVPAALIIFDESLMGTLYSWSLQTGIFGAPGPNRFKLRNLVKGHVISLEINVSGIEWGYSLYGVGKNVIYGAVRDSEQLLALLSRLIEPGKEQR